MLRLQLMEASIDRSALELARRTAGSAALLEALGGVHAYLVGGAVRDALLDRELDDIDIAVDGELKPVLERIGIAARTHERFGTARVAIDGVCIDLARTRRESYPHPGALPEVSPAPIRVDLARRDFTVNAMAVPLTGDLELIDPYDGEQDLQAGLLRVIHPDSFREDPTRALRAARYAARFGFELEAHTAELISQVDLGTVSHDRVEADLARICAEPASLTGLMLLREWGLLELPPERERLLEPLAELALLEPWKGLGEPGDLLLELVIGSEKRFTAAEQLAAASFRSEGEGYELARRHDELTLAIARALGADWVDSFVTEWRRVELEIDGAALLAAGVPEGPAVGRGLRAARHARIEGRIEADVDAELAVALAAAGHSGSGDPPPAGHERR